MSPMAHRQALASLRNGLPRRRPMHTSSRRMAAVVPVSTIQTPEEIVLSPIFDIFDAPFRLGDSSQIIREKARPETEGKKKAITKFNSPLPRPPPKSLPAPVTFDGPARPRVGPLAHRPKVTRLGHSPMRRRHAPSVQETSEPIIQLFEGPARITRYHHRPAGSKTVSPSYFPDFVIKF